MDIDDCLKGIDLIMQPDDLVGTPINLGPSELATINYLVGRVETIAGVKAKCEHDANAPRGVAGPNSDNSCLKQVLKWEPNTLPDVGQQTAYTWTKEEHHAWETGQRVAA